MSGLSVRNGIIASSGGTYNGLTQPMIYVFYGSDSFSRRESLQNLKRELDRDGALETNTTVLEARQVKPDEVFSVCDTAPFLGGCRLVILEGALSRTPSGGRGMRSRNAEAGSKGESGPWSALVEYAGRMPEWSALVLMDGESIAQGLLDALRSLAKVQRFSLPAPRDVPGWIQARAKAMGVSIDRRSCALLADLVGNDTWVLASELDKLSAYTAGEAITEKEVRALVTDVRDREGYLLAEAVADGKAAVATRLLHDLLAKGRPPAVLLLTLDNRYRRIAIAREMIDAGATGSNVAARLGIDKPYPLERLLEQVSRHSMTRVRRALDRLAEADYGVKQGMHDEELALELVVHDLASSEPASQPPGQRLSAAPAGSWW